MVMADGPPNCEASICTVQSAKNHSDNKNKDGHKCYILGPKDTQTSK